jgi:hypothetical protein
VEEGTHGIIQGNIWNLAGELRKSMEDLRQNNRPPARDLNSGTSEYIAGQLTTRSQLSVPSCRNDLKSRAQPFFGGHREPEEWYKLQEAPQNYSKRCSMWVISLRTLLQVLRPEVLLRYAMSHSNTR